MYDTIIIGAGMSGLAAGIRLAQYDRQVCILERHTTIGGLNSFYRLRGRNYDVGLHAVTNYTPKGTRRGPLARILRQLRIRWDDLALSPQHESLIAFPGVRLRFNNDPELLQQQVAAHFPNEADNFRRLCESVLDYDDLDESTFFESARDVVARHVGDPLLREMIFCPVMWYGNARQRDMDWGQFSIMFRSIFLEGFARPLKGVRVILKTLVRRFKQLGGELRLRAGVERIRVQDGRAIGVVLDDGQELHAKHVVSSAGWPETMRMCDDVSEAVSVDDDRMSFVEAISVTDRPPEKLGHDRTIVFYNDSDEFHWHKSTDFCDVRTGVICSPNNYLYEDAGEVDRYFPEGVVRVTAIANYEQWNHLDAEQYRQEKLRWYDRIVESAVQFVPDYRRHVIETDMFTPTTIRRFTWHDNGAVYGDPTKRLNGQTHLKNLFICGSDQGFVGIVGAIFSGISIANKHLLRAQ